MLKKQSGAFSVFDLPEWSGVVDKDRPESVKYTQDLAGSRDHRRIEFNLWAAALVSTQPKACTLNTYKQL